DSCEQLLPRSPRTGDGGETRAHMKNAAPVPIVMARAKLAEILAIPPDAQRPIRLPLQSAVRLKANAPSTSALRGHIPAMPSDGSQLGRGPLRPIPDLMPRDRARAVA